MLLPRNINGAKKLFDCFFGICISAVGGKFEGFFDIKILWGWNFSFGFDADYGFLVGNVYVDVVIDRRKFYYFFRDVSCLYK